jgi:hypothetical protein
MKRRTAAPICAPRDESGSALILALAILIGVGLLLGALARLATPIFAQAEVTRSLNDADAAIDAGLGHGIQTLQTSSLASNPGLCQAPPPGQPPQQLINPPYVNGIVPIVTCEVTSSSSSVSTIVLTSSPPVGTSTRIVSGRAVVQVNNFTGAVTILSSRICQDGPAC